MLTLTDNDERIIEQEYTCLLYKVKFIIEKMQLKSPIEIYKVVCDMFRNGQFSMDGTINFDNSFDYVTLPNMKYVGAQVMYGVCCCRHASSFINDVLKILGFESSIFYIYIDNDEWHISTPDKANHMTVLLKENNCEYLLDPTNNFILKKEPNNRLISIDTNTNLNVPNDIDLSNNIQEIGGVLKKYYYFKKFGINHIYDYE